MKRLDLVIVSLFAFSLLAFGGTVAPDESSVEPVTNQVESGTREISEGVEEADTGIGKTVSEGVPYGGAKLHEAGNAAGPLPTTAWSDAHASAVAFGQSVKSFATNLFLHHVMGFTGIGAYVSSNSQ